MGRGGDGWRGGGDGWRGGGGGGVIMSGRVMKV